MTALLCTLLMSLGLAPVPLPGAEFEAHFTGRTLRLDYVHVGDAEEEHLVARGLRLEGPWAGSRTALVDELNLGRYRVRIVDPESQRTLYARGFASIYGEWETTGEARRRWRSFEESQRFPEPRGPVQLVLSKRAEDGLFRELFSLRVDPLARTVDRSELAPLGEVLTLRDNGDPATHVDLLFVGDGYTAGARDGFEADVRRLTEHLFAVEPFRSRAADFNVRALFLPAAEAGISNPRAGVWRDSPLGLSFNAFDSDRYVLTEEDRALREAAAQAPYDALVLVFDARKYGGGGIYNLWSTCAADSSQAAYLLVHEFGHAFAGLADEYYTSSVSYEDFNPPGVEPWEPNVTALLDPARLKWGDLVEADTPLPTPWDQARYDQAAYAYQARRAELRAAGASEERLEALFDEVRALTAPMLAGEEFAGRVGAFEGAGYRAKGLYRPEVDCLMFTRNPKHFCRVCTRAIERVIDAYVR